MRRLHVEGQGFVASQRLGAWAGGMQAAVAVRVAVWEAGPVGLLGRHWRCGGWGRSQAAGGAYVTADQKRQREPRESTESLREGQNGPKVTKFEKLKKSISMPPACPWGVWECWDTLNLPVPATLQHLVPPPPRLLV